MADLLPCPFCGDAFPVLERIALRAWCIRCDACSAVLSTDGRKPETIAAWNRRAKPAPPAQAVSVPEGFWLVPKVPTEAMISAAVRLQGDDAFVAKAPALESAIGKIYRAMLSAATAAATREGKS